jgi:hypothetical protein
MGLKAIPRVLSDLTAINLRFLRSSEARAAFRHHAAAGASDPRVQDAELRRAPEAARVFAGLTPASLALAGLRTSADQPRSLNMVVADIRPSRLFAGMKTALSAASGLAERLELPLRIVVLEPAPAERASSIADDVGREIGIPVTIVPRRSLGDVAFRADDVWLATHSRTAHALQVAGAVGAIDPRRVAYLIQDYEPGFSAWSTESVVAAATYHAGFLPLVNSTPLAGFLRRREQLELDDTLVLAPHFDEDELRAVAARRAPSSRIRVLFYARPSKQRNLFELGISTLRAAARAVNGTDAEFVSAGEPHWRIRLDSRHRLGGLGQLDRERYFAELSRTQVVLALQQSPHPGHSAFDAAISGAVAVTNEFEGTRSGLHPRIIAADAETAALSAAVVRAIELSRSERATGYLPVAEGLLGNPLPTVLDEAASRLAARVD